jgi:glycogen synthase
VPLVTFYFQLHQPLRLHPDGVTLLWVEKNKEVFEKVTRKCYLPATFLFTDVVQSHPEFKICLSMSGTFLDQAERYQPHVIQALQDLYKAGQAHNQVEFLDETYYHSLVSLFEDNKKGEFREQVSLHRQKMYDLFGVRPTGFRNTELMYNNDVANVVADMGYKIMLCEKRDDMFAHQSQEPISPNAVFRAKGRRSRPRQLLVLPRNRELSDDVAFRFPEDPITPQQYAQYIAQVDGEALLLGYDYEHIGEHIWPEKGIFEFWDELADALKAHESVVMANPSEIAERFTGADCPTIDIGAYATSSWADVERNTFGWLGSFTQHTMFKRLQDLEPEARSAGGDMLRRFRMLTTSDHLYYLHEGKGSDRLVHDYFSPYNSLAAATYVFTHALDRLSYEILSFNILKRTPETPVTIIAPECARLPSDGMGDLAPFVSGKSGGLGEVVSALCKGLTDRGIPAHLITLNLARRFREEAGLSDHEWSKKRRRINPEYVHLVTSSIFEEYRSAYDGNPLVNAAEFQKQIVNQLIKNIHCRYEGRGLIHSHDWMAGGVVSAYANLRDIPLLHTIHNTHTGYIPVDMYYGVNLNKLWDRLYITSDMGRTCVDAQATAIKNASKISYVGYGFLREVVEDHFQDRHIIPLSVRQETKVKADNISALVIPNGISPTLFPENQPENPDAEKPGLARCFGPSDRIIEAKQANKIKFQKKMGLAVDPDSILLYWPSRLDPSQKGIELLEEIAQPFAEAHPDTQIAVLGDPVGGDMTHRDIIGRIACASKGRIAYRRFDEDLSLLGYAAASDVFGASLYEPFGQIDVMGNLYGATATNRDTGGYRDKINPLSLKVWGAPIDRGNGVLFQDYNAGGLWWGLSQTVDNHRFFCNNPVQWDRQIRRIMRQARSDWSLENMVAGYITAYEQLNAGRPLA